MLDDKLKQQRDRFLAFSFASSDLFIEVESNGIVSFSLGAARSLTGTAEQNILGKQWLELFAVSDRHIVTGMRSQATTGKRCGPYLVKLADSIGGGRQAIVTGITMPSDPKFYLTVGFTNVLMARYAQDLQAMEDYALLDKDGFLNAAREALTMARSLGQDLDLTLLDIDNVGEIKSRLGDQKWDVFVDSITHLLNSRSVDGQAAMIMEGRYGLIHDSSLDSDSLKAEIARLSRENDPSGQGFEVQSTTVSADLSTLSERDTSKALVYTINEFERKGAAMTIETLNTSFKTYVSANAQKIVQFKTMVEQLTFDLHFQPIVSLDTGEAVHYEMLSRFRDNQSTQEWVVFGEDIGMAAEFDIAVCERAINYVLYKSAGHRTKFAVNLSGQSIQNEQFFKTLHAKLSLNKGLSERLIFEITESNTIQDLEMVNRFIKILQSSGYKVCLDDFGAGSASFQYLHQLHVDYVKIDGSYTRRILTSERDAIMVKNLSQMCRDLKIKMIAEMIEEEAQAERLRNLGVQYGQGYLFGKAQPKPDYINEMPKRVKSL